MELFTSAQAQWLGVRVEAQPEQPRVMLLSVPYALKAGDAETLGGKPASAFLTASASGEVGSVAEMPGQQPSNIKPAHPLTITGSGTTNYVPLWTNASNLTSSVIYQATNRYLGVGTTNPSAVVQVQGGSSDVTGIMGAVTPTSGVTYGVVGKSNSNGGVGVFGESLSTTGLNWGVGGTSNSSSGIGVFGYNNSVTGTTYGVEGQISSTSGAAVYGTATNTSGTNYGVQGSPPAPARVQAEYTVSTPPTVVSACSD